MGTERHQSDDNRIDFTPAVALLGGQPTLAGGGLLAYPDRDIAANVKDALNWHGLRRYDKASGTIFSAGDTIIYDASVGEAVQPNLAQDADPTSSSTEDLEVAVCVEDAASADPHVVGIPTLNLDRYTILRPIVFDFLVGTGIGDVLEHILIPAWMNPHGLLFLGAYGLVTEVMAGSSEDQGIITIEDEDDNALCTITALNAAADVVNDVLVGTNDIYTASSGDAAKVVAANKAVQGFVSQQTAGTPAGGIKVYLRVIPLI